MSFDLSRNSPRTSVQRWRLHYNIALAAAIYSLLPIVLREHELHRTHVVARGRHPQHSNGTLTPSFADSARS
jgi:hypothetical protein